MTKRCWLIYVIIFISSFALFSYIPLKTEYLYKRVAESHNATGKKSYCGNQSESSNKSNVITDEVSRLNLVLDVTFLIPSSFVAILITAWGDRVGRKITLAFPLLGFILGGVVFSLIIYYSWPLETFYIRNVVIGLGGFLFAMLSQGAAYISDITEPEQRGTRFLVLEACFGVGAGIGGVISGYWLDVRGYLEPIICVTVLQFISLVIVFFLPDSTKIREKRNEVVSSMVSTENQHTNEQERLSAASTARNKQTSRGYGVIDLLKSVWRVYSRDYSHCPECYGPLASSWSNVQSEVQCIHKGRGFDGRRWRMWVYVIAENIFLTLYNGVGLVQTYYFLSQPLCFSPLLVGLQLGFKFILFAFSPLLVLVYQRCFSFTNNLIALTGLVGLLVYSSTLSFATTPAVVFAGTAALLCLSTTRPFILAQISGMVLKTEQGAALALVSYSEVVATLLSTVIFLTLYPATVGIYRGFIFAFAATCTLIPIAMITIIHINDRSMAHSYKEEDERLVTT